MKKQNLWTFNNGKITNHGVVKIDDKGYVNGQFPIEDFGDYLLTTDRLSPENAFEKFLKLTEEKGENHDQQKPVL